jgi:hypothetical protein
VEKALDKSQEAVGVIGSQAKPIPRQRSRRYIPEFDIILDGGAKPVPVSPHRAYSVARDGVLRVSSLRESQQDVRVRQPIHG